MTDGRPETLEPPGPGPAQRAASAAPTRRYGLAPPAANFFPETLQGRSVDAPASARQPRTARPGRIALRHQPSPGPRIGWTNPRQHHRASVLSQKSVHRVGAGHKAGAGTGPTHPGLPCARTSVHSCSEVRGQDTNPAATGSLGRNRCFPMKGSLPQRLIGLESFSTW